MADLASSELLRLPSQLLAQVLQHLCTPERLQSALTCSAFRTAAALATQHISVKTATPRKASAVTDWLQAHGQEAAVESINVDCGDEYGTDILLPLQHLAALRKLRLNKMHAFWSAEAAAANRMPSTRGTKAMLLPPELSALTCLSLQQLFVDLAALPAFTNLQYLELGNRLYGMTPTQYSWPSNLQSLSEALPKMQQLTALDLSHKYTQGAALIGLQQLSALQQLKLQFCMGTAASLQALPASLTSLYWEGDMTVPGSVVFSTATTPGLTQLTALQELTIHYAVFFEPTLLAGLTSLQSVKIMSCAMPAAGLSALSSLTQLQHLTLAGPQAPQPAAAAAVAAAAAAAAVPADFAALTASTQLTFLCISGGLVLAENYRHMFPPGRSLPHLQQLHATMGLVMNSFEPMVACCPGLRHLNLARTVMGEVELLQPDGFHDEDFSMYLLGDLTQLTCLSLNLEEEDFSEPLWRVMRTLTTLEHLEMRGLDWNEFGGVIELTTMRQLTSLLVDVGGAEYHPINLKNQAPPGSPPDVWCQLPSHALSMALIHMENTPGHAQSAVEAIRTMARVSAGVCLTVHARQRREQQELQQKLAEVQQQLREQQEQLDKHQQLVGDVLDMKAQLQAVLQQQQGE